MTILCTMPSMTESSSPSMAVATASGWGRTFAENDVKWRKATALAEPFPQFYIYLRRRLESRWGRNRFL